MKEELEKEILDQIEEQQENATLGQSIDFNELFRVKGRKGIYTILSPVNKSGMICMSKFLEKEKLTTNSENLVCLGHMQFHRELPLEPLTMNDVFDNIFSFYEDVKNSDCVISMENVVPQYDETMFKPYHLVKVLEWFNEINTKISKISNEESDKKED